MNQEVSKKEVVIDIVKDFLIWVVVTVLAYVWWMAVLLIASLVLLNVWMITFQEILKLSAVLTIVTSIAYVVRKVYKRVH